MKPASKLCLIAATLLMLGTGTAMAGTVAPVKANNVVLVHGSWADGSSWSDVITRLQAAGLHVTAVQNPLTSVADDLGPQLSGLISPFPAFSVLFAAFTHSQQGAQSASNLLRGVIVGSGAYAVFFLCVGLLLKRVGIAPTYLLACAAAVSFSALFYLGTRQRRR